MNITLASVKDLEHILSLNKKLFLHETQFVKYYKTNWAYSKQGKNYFSKAIDSNDYICLVARNDDQKIVGYLVCNIDEYGFRTKNPVAEVENMNIEEEFRGKGVGTMLIHEVKMMLKQRNVKLLRVECFAKNKKAIDFYRKTGFIDHALILEQEI
jgi:ribosomal protein S18 acetylase RimI-like enzyme